MDNIELKPCPFCGGKAQFMYNIDCEPDGILCRKCQYVMRFLRIHHKPKDTFGETMEKMAEVWNRRTNSNG